MRQVWQRRQPTAKATTSFQIHLGLQPWHIASHAHETVGDAFQTGARAPEALAHGHLAAVGIRADGAGELVMVVSR